MVHLRTLELLAFLKVKYGFPQFFWYFSFRFLTYICEGTLQKNYLKNKRFWLFLQIQDSFTSYETTWVLFVLRV